MRGILVFLLGLGMGALAAAAPGAWPGGRQAAVVLTYDDARTSQLENAVPALDANGLKATFFLFGTFDRRDLPRWRAVAAEGHELGNHTVFHPCPRGMYDMPAQYNSESYTTQTMLAEISAMNSFLTAIDGKDGHSFAMPCGTTTAGSADYLEALRASGIVKYARGTGGLPGFDPLNVNSIWFDERDDGTRMIAAADEVRRSGGLLVYGFHGVGGDYLKVSAEAHRRLVEYLHAHESEIWVAPFGDVIDYAVKHKLRLTGKGSHYVTQ